jgi:hypothetical protein
MNIMHYFIIHTTPDIWQKMQIAKILSMMSAVAISPKAPLDQILNLQELTFAAAMLAERNLQSVRDITQGAYTSNHAFNAKLLLSRAEGTVHQYSAKNPCWGCGKGTNVWANWNGKLVCPCQDDLECLKKAATPCIKFVAS